MLLTVFLAILMSLGVIVIAVWDGFRSNSLLYSRLYQRLRRGY